MAPLNHILRTDVWVEAKGEEPPGRSACLGGRLLQSEPSGQVRAELVRLCDEAEQTILLCSFLLADEALEQALLRAATRGVRVYLLIASETRLEKAISEQQEFDRKTMQEHKDLLDRLAGQVLLRSAEHLHAKFLMTDVAAQPRGVLLTCNLTHDALQRNWELASFLRSEEVVHLWRLFTWAFWEQAQKELLTPGRLEAVKPRGLVALPTELGALRVTAGAQRSLLREVLVLINGARRELLVSSFGFGYEEIMQALYRRAREGLAVTVLTRPRPAIVASVHQLALAKAQVFGVPHLHGKALVADGGRGLLMTANLDDPSMTHSFEVGVACEGEDAAVLRQALWGWREAARWEFRPLADLRGLRGRRVLIGQQLRNEDIIDVDELLQAASQQTPVAPAGAKGAKAKGAGGKPRPRKQRR